MDLPLMNVVFGRNTHFSKIKLFSLCEFDKDSFTITRVYDLAA